MPRVPEKWGFAGAGGVAAGAVEVAVGTAGVAGNQPGTRIFHRISSLQ